jgi:hypothetical protein
MTVAELQRIIDKAKKNKSRLEDTRIYISLQIVNEKNKQKPDDAKIKSLNADLTEATTQINKLNSEIKKNEGYKTSLSKTVTIDARLKNLYSQYATLIARGEKTAAVEKEIESALSERKTILTAITSYAPSYAPKSPIPDNWKKTTTKIPTTKKPSFITTTKKPSGTTTKKPSGTTTKKPSGTTTAAPGGTTKKPFKTFEKIIEGTEFWYNLPDYIFEQDEVLKRILEEAVQNDWDEKKFISVVQSKSTWWQKNEGPIRERIIDLAKYNDLRSRGIDVSNTAYGLYLSKNLNAIKSRAQELAGVALSDAQAQKIVEQIYNGFLDDDQTAIDRLILPYLGKITTIAGGKTTQTYSGEALRNYQMLQAIAFQNGLTLKDILPNVSTATTAGDLEKAVLQKIALGEINVNAVAQAARNLAAQGQPEYVKNLLTQGYDLSQVFSPYRNVMAAELEINPDEISLNDPLLRSAITEKGEQNMYDFKKILRKDSRWPYTENARNEVAGAVSSILRDFGFQG